MQEFTVFNVAQIDTLPATAEQLKAAYLLLSKELLYTKCEWPSRAPEVLQPYWKHTLELSLM